eukprot:246356-Pleurochrysis_carterae.AAC.1
MASLALVIYSSREMSTISGERCRLDWLETSQGQVCPIFGTQACRQCVETLHIKRRENLFYNL